MKKLFVVVGLLALVPVAAFAQATYYVNYYADNAGPGASFDQTVRIINVGKLGMQLSNPAVGEICADIYVFDTSGELIACCDQRIAPNWLSSASVANQLTNDSLTTVIPASGVVKIATTPAPCGTPLTSADASLAVVFGTHLQVTGGATYVTETQMQASPLSVDEATFLPEACSFARYMGSGRAICTTSTPGQ